MQVWVLGASGMLGAMVTEVLARDPSLEVTATVRSQEAARRGEAAWPRVHWMQFNALDPGLSGLSGRLHAGDWIVNAIGITKPLIRDDNAAEVERAVRVNSLFPHLLAREAETSGARVLQIATDCVYSGTRGAYLEPDPQDALDVYGKTKSLGEVTSPAVHHLRCSIIGPEPKEFKFLIEWFRRQPSGAQVNGFVNHRWNGLTTLHFAKLCLGIIRSGLELNRLQHVLPTDTISKAEMLKLFARVYRRPDIHIQETEAPKVIDRTLATQQPEANRRLWAAAGYAVPPTVPEMLAELGRTEFRLGADHA